MRFISLFSGIEAASVAWKQLGWECVAVAEIEKFPCAVLKHHYPNVPNLGDVAKITREMIESLGHVDVVVFGFPCQDLSVAGKRKGLKNADGSTTRSGLFFVAERIAQWSKARWTIGENVPGLFSSNEGRDFAAVVGELVGSYYNVPGNGWRNSGVALGPKGLVEWFVLDAQYRGLAQRRKRVFFVRDSGNWSNRPPLFLVESSLCWNFAPCRQKRQSTAADAGKSIAGGRELGPTLAALQRGGGGLGTDAECDGGVIPIQEIGKRQSGTSMNGVGHGQPGDPMFTLQAAAVHGVAMQMAPENGVPEVPRQLQERDAKGSDSSTKDGHLIPVEMQVCNTLKAEGFDGMPDGTGAPAVAFEPGSIARNAGPAGESHLAPKRRSEMGDNQPAVRTGMQVRRLTPTECARLQGFPDDYLRIHDKVADGPMYKALGNSMAVPVMKWLGERIQLVDQIKD